MSLNKEPSIYCGASSRHIHCENYDFKAGEILKIFGNENPDERTTWLDIRNCTGTIDLMSLSLLSALEYLNITGSNLEILPQAFKCLPKLRALDFRNSKILLAKQIFEGCTIKHLLIEDLTLPNTDCFFHLKSLDNLTFENCKFEKFSGNILHNLKLLEYLFIKKCQMESLDDFHKDTEQLQNLYIMNNNIGELNYKSILKLENLKCLALHDNVTTTNINYEDFQKLPKLETILFGTAIYKNINFSSFPSLKKVQIGTYGGAGTDEESELMKKLEKLNLEFEFQFCGTVEVDMSKVQICA